MRLAESPVMSSSLGFGQDGSDSRTETLSDGREIRCVDSGPFSDLRPSYIAVSPIEVLQKESHCLFRSLIDGDTPASRTSASIYNATYVGIVQGEERFETYSGALEGGPHGIIHSALGGEMNPTTSPNGELCLIFGSSWLTAPEPLFFLHHAQVDRLWWKWQQESLAEREFDFAGTAAHRNTSETTAASLDDLLFMGGLDDDLRVGDVMSTTSRLCYNYAN